MRSTGNLSSSINYRNRSIYTAFIYFLRDTVIKVLCFQINVGCTPQSTDKFPVRLEYSQDHGKTWRLVVPPCSLDRLPMCSDREIDTTVYYAGRTEYWRRIVVPLNGLQICGCVMSSTINTASRIRFTKVSLV